jgi:hypothetical protein
MADIVQEEIHLEYPKICDVCKEQNLTCSIMEHVLTCPGCSSAYCIHFASSVDPAICKDCCHDVVMTETVESVKRETYNKETDSVTVRSHKYRSIKFSGLDWLFFTRKINTLSDLELDIAIEYHFTIYNSMMYEREKRRIEYYHRNAGKHVPIRTSSAEVVSSVTSVKSSKTTKPRNTTSKEVNAASLVAELLQKGATPAQILAALGRK